MTVHCYSRHPKDTEPLVSLLLLLLVFDGPRRRRAVQLAGIIDS